MLRRLMLSALALIALLALAGCGVNRVMAPDVATEQPAKPPGLGRNEPVTDPSLPQDPGTPERPVDPRREGDGGLTKGSLAQ